MMDETNMLCVECSRCSHNGERAVACHPECLALVPSESCSAFLEATSYRYQPPKVEDERRARWLRLRWRSILNDTYCLPVELCDHIAQYCLRTFAVLCGLASWETISRHVAPSHVSFSAKVWARFTLFEGLSYLLFLTNQEPTTDDARVQLAFDPEFSHLDTAMFVAEDHLGVREVILTPSFKTPTIGERPVKERQNLWWRSLVVRSLDSTREGQLDVRSRLNKSCGLELTFH